MTGARNPIAVALDVPTVAEARALAEQIGDAAGVFKIGLELMMAEGPAAVRALEGRRVFLDVKLHDIPTTVRRALKALAPLGVDLVNVHALGGSAMLEAAAEVKGETKLLAVTILTSLDDAALKELGLPPAAEAVPALAQLAMASGCDGVVCAPTDIAAVRSVCPPPFLLVTPGIRPAGADRGDQARVATPKGALEAGADLLVIGRPITAAHDPRAAALSILEEIR
jgi:orotidine-5'-phosphate decarboxylase